MPDLDMVLGALPNSLAFQTYQFRSYQPKGPALRRLAGSNLQGNFQIQSQTVSDSAGLSMVGGVSEGLDVPTDVNPDRHGIAFVLGMKEDWREPRAVVLTRSARESIV